MNKNIRDSKQLISEMKYMLNPKNEKRGLLESIIYGEDGEEMMNDEHQSQMPNQMDNQNAQQMQMRMGDGEQPNPLDEDPEIAKLITGIRVQTLQGLTKLAQHPESAQYDLLKKIFLLVDKAVEDKVDRM